MKPTIDVYRVERDGEGPYRDSSRRPIAAALCSAHGWQDTRRPSWHCDVWESSTHTQHGYARRAACPTLDALAQWFVGFGPRLRAAGFKVCRYRVPETLVVEAREGLGQTIVLNYEEMTYVEAYAINWE